MTPACNHNKPTSGRLEGYVLTFLCSHKLTVPDFNSECEPRNNAALLTQYPPQAEGRARARADFIALPFLVQLKSSSTRHTETCRNLCTELR